MYRPQQTPLTEFPIPNGNDLALQERMIVEKWKRMFPLIPYYQLKFIPTAQVNLNTPTGNPVGMVIDPVYDRPVPVGTTVAGDNPHDPGGTDATVRKVFHTTVTVNLAVQREATDDELKQWGFDRVRDLLVKVPLKLLDERNIQVQPGDEFDWGSERMEVLQSVTAGYWKNTTIRLYMVMNCKSKRFGS